MEIRNIGPGWPLTLGQSPDLVDCCSNTVGISKLGFKVANELFKII
jgi:hypothetical protein